MIEAGEVVPVPGERQLVERAAHVGRVGAVEQVHGLGAGEQVLLARRRVAARVPRPHLRARTHSSLLRLFQTSSMLFCSYLVLNFKFLGEIEKPFSCKCFLYVICICC